MKVSLIAGSSINALNLRSKIIEATRCLDDSTGVRTWSYTKSKEEYDLIFHNPAQYVDVPSKNVLFRLTLDGAIVSFEPVWWSSNPKPDDDVICLHIGRLTEFLLRYFKNYFIKFVIVN